MHSRLATELAARLRDAAEYEWESVIDDALAPVRKVTGVVVLGTSGQLASKQPVTRGEERRVQAMLTPGLREGA